MAVRDPIVRFRRGLPEASGAAYLAPFVREVDETLSLQDSELLADGHRRDARPGTSEFVLRMINGRLHFRKFMLDKQKVKDVLSKSARGMIQETKLPAALAGPSGGEDDANDGEDQEAKHDAGGP